MVARASELPRIRVAALMRIDDRVVLVRHRAGDRTYHLLPGGGVSWGETLHEALAREVAEETGLEVTVGALLFVSDTIAPDGSRHVVNLTFRAQVVSGALIGQPADPRVEAVELVDPASLASLDLRPPFAEELREAFDDPDSRARYLGSRYKPDEGARP